MPAPAVPGGVAWLVMESVPLARLPTTVVLPLTVRLPLRFSENALMPPENVGEAGSFGKMTLGICLVVIPGPEISISYFPGAA